jgi:hypothetical protein
MVIHHSGLPPEKTFSLADMKRIVIYAPPKLHAAFKVWLARLQLREREAPRSLSAWFRREMDRRLRREP